MNRYWRPLLALLLLSTIFLQVSAASPKLIDIGSPATSPFGLSLDGEPITPLQHQGKVIVALYYTSWCGYCRKAMPDFMQFQEAASSQGLQVFFINHKEDRKHFRDHVRWAKDSSVLMSHDKKGSFGEAYDVQSYPHILVIDREGKLVVTNKGYGDNSKNYYVNLLNHLLIQKDRTVTQTQSTFSEQTTPPIQPKTRQTELDISRDIQIEKPDIKALLSEQ